MDLELVFTIANLSVLPAWIALAVAPRAKLTGHLAHSVVMPALLGLAYVVFIAQGIGGGEGDFSSLAGVMRLFDRDVAVLAGWIHYLVFDLFVGAWEVRDAQRRGIHHGWVLPCLGLTLMLGPSGLLAYLVMRAIRSPAGRMRLDEVAA